MMPGRTFRRRVAILGLVTLGFFMAESLVPDVCDPDARAVAGFASADGVPSSQGTPPGTPPAAPNSQAPDHPVHVCHCAHGHFGGVAVAEGLGVATVVHEASVIILMQRLLSSTIQPPLRPPIA